MHLPLGHMSVNSFCFQSHYSAVHYAFVIGHHLMNPHIELLFHLLHGFITHSDVSMEQPGTWTGGSLLFSAYIVLWTH